MIVCIGEIVWDIFESASVLGGAPLNVAYHLNSLGQEVTIISRVGNDQFGENALAKIANLGLPVDSIQKDDIHPSGKVLVNIGKDNEPSYDIMAPAAWDFIEADSTTSLGTTPFYIVCGTLAQRSERSRETIRSLWTKADNIFYDVNLRPPHTTKDLVIDSLDSADVVKINDFELYEIAGWYDLTSQNFEFLSNALLEKFNLKALTVTLGKDGAILSCSDGFFKHNGFSVEVADTVGSGDAFFAALIDGIIKKLSWEECLLRANKLGSFVASQSGATPPTANQI